MRSLVWRYVSAMHRRFEESPVTEDDINEVKGEITAMRFELLEIFEKNGMDLSSIDRKEKSKYLNLSPHCNTFIFILITHIFSSLNIFSRFSQAYENLGASFDERFPSCSG